MVRRRRVKERGTKTRGRNRASEKFAYALSDIGIVRNCRPRLNSRFRHGEIRSRDRVIKLKALVWTKLWLPELLFAVHLEQGLLTRGPRTDFRCPVNLDHTKATFTLTQT